ncbi:diguanylate cyclase [Pseudomonas sp. LRF_L74]|uniref:sensor domain-containing diguanylate cyclase n=1 Tax=Pseudomonas sp. LRF_L74 TaxID=3369422 RepID=UPI003F601BC5
MDTIKSRSKFARRALLPRTTGLAVGALCVTVPFWELQRSSATWAGLLLFCFAWPWIAYGLSRYYHNPARMERWHILFDSFAAPVAVVGTGFSPIATAVVFSTLVANNVATGGVRFVWLGFVAQLAGTATGLLIFGLSFNPAMTLLHLYACLPMMLIQPLVIGLTLYHLALNVAQSRRALRTMSQTDSLTGLYNRHHWSELATLQMQRCKRSGEAACLALIDLDHFKAVNDSHGHLAGDALLGRLGATMRTLLRQVDLAGRYGGDEFCVVLPMTLADDARVVFERLRVQFVEQEPQQVGLSVGIAAYQPGLDSVEQWIDVADRALYQAKAQGRNQVVVANAEAGRQAATDIA